MASPAPSAPPPPSSPDTDGLDTVAIGGIIFASLAVFIVLSAMVYRAVGGRGAQRQQYAAASQTLGPASARGIFAHVPEAGDGLSGEGCAVPEGLPLLRIKSTAAGAV